MSYRRPAARNQFDVDFLKLVMMVVGEQFGEDGEQVCGIVLSPRRHTDRIELWARHADRKESLRRMEAVLAEAIQAVRGSPFTPHSAAK